MLTRSGPFYVFEIARAVARLPGRAEVDAQEAHRVAGDMADWYFRGEFRDCEVLVHADDPSSPRPLAEVIEDARRRDPKWDMSQPNGWRPLCSRLALRVATSKAAVLLERRVSCGNGSARGAGRVAPLANAARHQNCGGALPHKCSMTCARDAARLSSLRLIRWPRWSPNMADR